KGRQQADRRVDLAHGARELRDRLLVLRTADLVADLPELHAVRLWVPVRRAPGAERACGRAVGVLHLGRGVPRGLPGPPHADERLRIDLAAKINELVEADAVRLEAAPAGRERRAAVGLADPRRPLVVLHRGSAEADHAGAQLPERLHDVRPPAAPRAGPGNSEAPVC